MIKFIGWLFISLPSCHPVHIETKLELSMLSIRTIYSSKFIRSLKHFTYEVFQRHLICWIEVIYVPIHKSASMRWFDQIFIKLNHPVKNLHCLSTRTASFSFLASKCINAGNCHWWKLSRGNKIYTHAYTHICSPFNTELNCMLFT